MRQSPLLTALVGATLLVGCGVTDTGSGTDTMRVNLMVSYKFGGSEQSICTATVSTPGGLPVKDAEITITGEENGAPLVTLVHDEATDGNYIGTFDGYQRELYLNISSSQDGTLSAALEGPSRHVIASPLHSSTVERSDIQNGLTVSWNSENGLKADEVVLRIPEKTEGFGDDDDEIENYVYQSGSIEDTGSGTIPSDRLTDTESIQVLRRNTVSLSGGYEGSLFGISYIVENSVQVNN